MHAEEHDEEDCEHDHHVSVDAHSVPGVHLLEDAADHVGGEEPKADVEPGHNHADVTNYFYDGRRDVDSELEDAASQVSHIVQNHNSGTDGKVSNTVGEENERESEEVMERVLYEVDPLSV